ncbi:MAG: tRNA (adenosine(37)-N6)-dimethylallyltransferase MiaA [Candidatus Krumholzibacteriota bacterium]|nr:tRNA (adenosine(37)-N6)-dimethylallyltransferase MiaA [Candidatus Krumholzibacteriota bacterium]
MDPLLIIGPTAAGKSALAMRVASEFDAEIVSIDSRQIYRKLDIGTAKPSFDERMKVPHHMIDIIDIDEKSDANTFGLLSRKVIDDILRRGKLPILVGGSGMYLRAVLEGFFSVDLKPAERISFAASIEGTGTEALYERLRAVDPESSLRIHHNDRYRIVRALEVHALTGTTISEFFARHRYEKKELFAHNLVKTGLKMERGELKRIIGERTLEMFHNGWVEEVDSILKSGAERSWPGMMTLGYPQIVRYIRGVENKEDTVERIILLTRQYAKRQMTWFNKESGVTWIDTGRNDPFETLIKCLDRRGGS